eukprot:NODE_14627_length_1096_cov_19.924665.p1 GENE.NODE_14627_length_1096_cov_19.924665~~NODE_14627_length_1096_cov_19.924665.p1  ORF type:complete len:304 (-),score=54.44 NODE_14627_length_1096_cov_19.924665:96-1007(-)
MEPVDCGFCTVEFIEPPKSGGPLAQLRIRSCTGEYTPDAVVRLCEALNEAFCLRIDFTTLYDFRVFSRPSVSATKQIARYVMTQGKTWGYECKGGVVLLTDNIWAGMAKGVIGIYCKIAPPECPFIICHSEAAGCNFIAQHVRPVGLPLAAVGSLDSFVSITSADSEAFALAECAHAAGVDVAQLQTQPAWRRLARSCCAFIGRQAGKDAPRGCQLLDGDTPVSFSSTSSFASLSSAASAGPPAMSHAHFLRSELHSDARPLSNSPRRSTCGGGLSPTLMHIVRSVLCCAREHKVLMPRKLQC